MDYLPLYLQRVLPLVNAVSHSISNETLVNRHRVPRWTYKYIDEDVPLILAGQYKDHVKLLHYACKKGYIRTIKYLVEKCGVDINTQKRKGRTALLYVIKCNKSMEIIKYLVEHGAQVHVKCEDKWLIDSALFYCCDLNIIEYLVGNDISRYLGDINWLEDNHVNRIINGNKNGPLALYLIKHGFTINNHAKLFNIICAAKQPIELIDYYLSHYSIDKNNTTPFINAIKERQPFDVLKYISGIININTVDVAHDLVKYGYSRDVIEYFVKPRSDMVPLAYLYNTLDTVLWLQNVTGYSMDVNDAFKHILDTLNNFDTDACKNCNNGLPDIIKYLVDNGADVNMPLKDDMTPLFTLLRANSPLCVIKCLVDHGANVHAISPKGGNAFHYAIYCIDSKYFDVLKYLLECGVDVNATDRCGNTPIQSMLPYHWLGVKPIKYMIKYGANINILDDYGTSLLDDIISDDCMPTTYTIQIIELLDKYGLHLTGDHLLLSIEADRHVRLIIYIANKLKHIGDEIDGVSLIPFALEYAGKCGSSNGVRLFKYLMDERGVKILASDIDELTREIETLDSDEDDEIRDYILLKLQEHSNND